MLIFTAIVNLKIQTDKIYLLAFRNFHNVSEDQTPNNVYHIYKRVDCQTLAEWNGIILRGEMLWEIV